MQAMDKKAKDCENCHQGFDEEDRCPRILGCFHTLCSTCVGQQITKNTVHCPFCNKKFRAKSANSIKVNQAALELVKYISHDLESAIPRDYASCPKVRRSNARKINRHLRTECHRAKKKILKMNKVSRSLVGKYRRENSRIKKEILPKLRKITTQNQDNCRMLRGKQRLWPKLFDDVHEKQGRLMELKEKLDRKLSDKEMDALTTETEDVNKDTDQWMKNVHDNSSKDDRTLQSLEKAFESAEMTVNFISQILTRGEVSLHNKREILPEGVSVEMKRTLNATLWRLATQGDVFAIQQDDAKIRSAKITIAEDNKLCLHHLTDNPIPPNSHVFKFSEVLKLVNNTSKLTFFDLADKETTLGRMYIRLTSNSRDAQLFTYLCTGEKGISYADRKLLQVQYISGQGELVHCGFNEPLDPETTGKLLSNIKSTGSEESRCPMTVKAVSCYRFGVNTTFNICIKDGSKDQLHDTIFGSVEKGIQHLIGAVKKYPNVTEVSFGEVGMVLSESRYQ